MSTTTNDDQRLTISVKEAARLIPCGLNQCYELVRCGEIPTVTVGSRIKVLRGPFLKKFGKE